MYSKKSEMWSLGVVLYEVMALRRPFGGSNMDELINNICSANRRPLPNYLSEELVGVCDQLLSVNPEKRPSLRALFQQPFIAKNLKILQHSVERHNRILEQIRAEISQCITNILSCEKQSGEVVKACPRKGIVKRHTAGSGWQDCELALTDEEITMRHLDNGKTETAPLSALTSVCPIDEPIAGERFVFAVRKHSGKAYWFKVGDKATFEAWMTALQVAVR
ncbi:unnamed protein product [Phytomonas sp. EM1]|nr:unnamed protein product [Phytomonas sp. EM1]|eukprot:CCW65455.1 unnamed protein product [Phytomonas sp. isolate EM1]